MTQAKNIREHLKLFEATDTSYVGAISHPSISYKADMKAGGEITKVTAFLSSYESGRYTKLGRTLNRIERLESRIKTLKEETKAETKELVADLFHAEDAACTRVVDTVSFVFHMSKDPKASSTVKYAKVLEELQEKLTPELQQVLETLIAKHTSAPIQKSPSLKTTDKAMAEEGINEGITDKLKGFFVKLRAWVDDWGARYDTQLAQLKAQAGIIEAVEEDDGVAQPTRAPRTSTEARFTEKDLRAAHKAGWEKGRQTSPSYKGGYHSSMWDLSQTRAALGLGPRGR